MKILKRFRNSILFASAFLLAFALSAINYANASENTKDQKFENQIEQKFENFKGLNLENSKEEIQEGQKYRHINIETDDHPDLPLYIYKEEKSKTEKVEEIKIPYNQPTDISRIAFAARRNLDSYKNYLLFLVETFPAGSSQPEYSATYAVGFTNLEINEGVPDLFCGIGEEIKFNNNNVKIVEDLGNPSTDEPWEYFLDESNDLYFSTYTLLQLFHNKPATYLPENTTWDYTSDTLTLNNADVSNLNTIYFNGVGDELKNVKINVPSGTTNNFVTKDTYINPHYCNDYSFHSYNMGFIAIGDNLQSFNITGGGKLNITNKETAINKINPPFIKEVKKGEYGLWKAGIFAEGIDVDISGETQVNIMSEETDHASFYLENPDLEISIAEEVNAGILCKNLNVTEASVLNVEAGDTSQTTFGIMSTGNINIQGFGTEVYSKSGNTYAKINSQFFSDACRSVAIGGFYNFTATDYAYVEAESGEYEGASSQGCITLSAGIFGALDLGVAAPKQINILNGSRVKTTSKSNTSGETALGLYFGNIKIDNNTYIECKSGKNEIDMENKSIHKTILSVSSGGAPGNPVQFGTSGLGEFYQENLVADSSTAPTWLSQENLEEPLIVYEGKFLVKKDIKINSGQESWGSLSQNAVSFVNESPYETTDNKITISAPSGSAAKDITVEAIPNSGFEFESWIIDTQSNETGKLEEGSSIMANFKPVIGPGPIPPGPDPTPVPDPTVDVPGNSDTFIAATSGDMYDFASCAAVVFMIVLCSTLILLSRKYNL